MKKKKNVIIIILSIIVIGIITFALYSILNDKNKLTVVERNWINDNISTVQNINVINNTNVFGKNASGVYYDFIADFENEYNLTINPITFNSSNIPSGISLGVKNSVSDNDIVFYEDHYVLVGKQKEIVTTDGNLNGKTVGILSSDLDYVNKYIKSNVTYTQFQTKDELISAMDEQISYMIVPLMDYLDIILSKDYNIIYHFSDIKVYYTMSTTDDTLSRVLKKFYNKWDGYDKSFNQALFKTFTSNLNISEADVAAMQGEVYNYGFVNASPYEVITGGKYGGIVAVILSKFSNMSDVEFNFVKYKSFDKFENAVNKDKVDLYFNYYNYSDGFNSTDGITIEYSVVAPRDDNKVVKSIYSLVGDEVYVQKNSKIESYVKSIDGINVKTFSTMNDLFKLNNKNVYIVLDKNTFDYYKTKKLDNYTERFSSYLTEEYAFKVKDNSALYKLLNKFVGFVDEEEVINEGVNNHYETVKSGGVITKLAEYIIYAVILVIVILLIIFKKSKKITVAKKIKKDDKMKFIDQLTSLKNRNYMTENIEAWNNNIIYPQTIMVIDLNRVQEINDLYGYNEGDKQIMAMANILIKTQLDNSEIMRTDGNEFVIYFVGYNQKQISNYIHKLTKEIKKLPYNYGAEFGYSMIVDDIKTIEDALNEAVEDMKKQKGMKDEKAKG